MADVTYSLRSGSTDPAPGEAVLITSAVLRKRPEAERYGVVTVRQDLDASSALVRGIAEYLKRLYVIDAGGKRLSFAQAVENQTEPEDRTRYPWATVAPAGEAMFIGGSGTGPSHDKRIVHPDGRELYPVKLAELRQELALSFVVGSKAECQALMLMLENELQYPAESDGRYGICLELPYYCGKRADYAPVSSRIMEQSAEDSASSLFRGSMRVSASIAMVRVVERLRLRPSVTQYRDGVPVAEE